MILFKLCLMVIDGILIFENMVLLNVYWWKKVKLKKKIIDYDM